MTISHIATDGGRLAAEVQGEGPLVVCSPGLGDTRDAYGPLAAALVAQGFRVACVDLRGHGDSSATFDRYGDEATSDDLLAVVEALGGGPAVLVGASLSGGAAVIAAGRRPEAVAGLVLLGPFLRNGMGPAGRRLLHAGLAKPWGPVMWRSYAAKLWPGLGPRRPRARRRRRSRWRALAAGPLSTGPPPPTTRLSRLGSAACARLSS